MEDKTITTKKTKQTTQYVFLIGELREHFAQFGHVQKCTVPFDKQTGFHRGRGWIQLSSKELHNAL